MDAVPVDSRRSDYHGIEAPSYDDPAQVEAWYRSILAELDAFEVNAAWRSDGHGQRLIVGSRRRRPSVRASFGRTFFVSWVEDHKGGWQRADCLEDGHGPDAKVALGSDCGGLFADYRPSISDDAVRVFDRSWIQANAAKAWFPSGSLGELVVRSLGVSWLFELIAEPSGGGTPDERTLARAFAFWAMRWTIGSRPAARRILEWDDYNRLNDAARRRAAEAWVIKSAARARASMGRFEP
jgi:hypothetical protein